MLKNAITFSFMFLFLAGILLAHGNATHLMGTVTALGKDTVTIQDKDGKTVVVMLEKTTKYFKDEEAGDQRRAEDWDPSRDRCRDE